MYEQRQKCASSDIRAKPPSISHQPLGYNNQRQQLIPLGCRKKSVCRLCPANQAYPGLVSSLHSPLPTPWLLFLSWVVLGLVRTSEPDDVGKCTSDVGNGEKTRFSGGSHSSAGRGVRDLNFFLRRSHTRLFSLLAWTMITRWWVCFRSWFLSRALRMWSMAVGPELGGMTTREDHPTSFTSCISPAKAHGRYLTMEPGDGSSGVAAVGAADFPPLRPPSLPGPFSGTRTVSPLRSPASFPLLISATQAPPQPPPANKSLSLLLRMYLSIPPSHPVRLKPGAAEEGYTSYGERTMRFAVSGPGGGEGS